MIELAKKWQENTISPDEREEFNRWYNSSPKTLEEDKDADEYELEQRMLGSILKEITPNVVKRPSYRRTALFATAAVITILICFGLLSKIYLTPKVAAPVQSAIQYDALPGSNRATLTLDNGEKIDLAHARNGELKTDILTKVSKISGNRLVYSQLSRPGSTDHSQAIYHTLSTPRSGMFQVTLSDGTHLWLNSGSVIRFPKVFENKERVVYLTGEAYFEVTKNRHKPFLVVTPKQTVEVLGTHFNVSAYEDETVTKTTLLEGKVKVASVNSNGFSVIRPNEQALSQANGIQVIKANASDAVGWKNGYFIFNHTDLRSLLRQFSRWYDVDIVYKGEVPNDFFQGQIRRDIKLNQALKILAFGDIHFKLENRKLIVLP